MKRRVWIGTVILLVAAGMPHLGSLPRAAFAAHVIENTEEQVNGHAARYDADRQAPDISGDRIIWQDFRESTTFENQQGWWLKDLSTRSESPLNIPNTAFSEPNISGDWVSWVLGVPIDDFNVQGDIYARELPGGPVITITADPAQEISPHQDGTTIVWAGAYATATGFDIWKKSLTGGTPVLVSGEPGIEFEPKVSGDTIIWTESDENFSPILLRGRTGTGPSFDINTPGKQIFGHAIDGNRIVWGEGTFIVDPCCSLEDQVVLTCVLPSCASGVSETVSATVGAFQAGPDVSGSRIVWTQCETLEEGCHIFVRNMGVDPGGVQVDFGIGTGPHGSAAIDGTRVVWQKGDHGPLPASGAIYWRDLANSDPPRLANSPRMGRLATQFLPTASPDFSAYLAPNLRDLSNIGANSRIFVTDLNGDRRDFNASTFDDIGTFVSPPRITGSRIAWKDRRNCPLPLPLDLSCRGDVFTRILDPLGPETPVTSTVLIGNQPDVDGTKTAWICGLTDLCVDDGGVGSMFSLTPSTPTHTVDTQLHVSGSIVLWAEFDTTLANGVLHALDTTTGLDSVMGSGSVPPTWLPSFDMSGPHVVWVSGGDIYYNDYSLCVAPCDLSASATLFAATPNPGAGVSIDGVSVAWDQFVNTGPEPQDGYQAILLKDIGETFSHTVTVDGNGPAYVNGDFVYWTRNAGGGGQDIFRESISGLGATFTVDSTPPGLVTDFFVTSTTGVTTTLTWTNPPDSDLFATRILRKNGSAPTSVDDTSATLIFDGFGTAAVDTDRVAGVSYVYAAFPYDEVPNFGASTLGGQVVEAPVTQSEGGSVTTGDTSTGDPVASEVTVPAGSASNDVTLTVTEVPSGDPESPPPPSGFGFGGQTVNVTLDPPTTTFAATDPAILVLSYDESILAPGQDENTIPVFRTTGTSWDPIGEPCTGGDGVDPLSPDPCIFLRDTTANTITIKTTEFSGWALGVPPVLSALSLSVDLSGPGDDDGLLEEDETVRVAPTWRNLGGATATSLTGSIEIASCPLEADCDALDASAAYGDVGVSAIAACSDCYTVSVVFPGARTSLHRDVGVTETLSSGETRVWSIHVANSFTDVNEASFGYPFIERILHNEVTLGCGVPGPRSYCPNNAVPRWQMALFIARALPGPIPTSGIVPGKGAYNCTVAGASVFGDVSPTDSFCKEVHYIASQGVTLGCTATLYCPNGLVIRADMARFISRAITGGDSLVPESFTDIPSGRSYSCALQGTVLNFDDVTEADLYCEHVHFLWAKGVVSGTTLTTYSPFNFVSREQMGKFLALGFGLEAWT